MVAPQKESDLVNKILTDLRGQYPSSFWTKIHGGPYQRAGIPDIIGCHNGRFVGFEVKLPGKEHTVTALQQYTLEELAKAGAVTGMVTCYDDVSRYLSGLDLEPDG